MSAARRCPSLRSAVFAASHRPNRQMSRPQPQRPPPRGRKLGPWASRHTAGKLPLGYSLVLFSSLALGFVVLYEYQSYRVTVRRPLPSEGEIAETNASLAATWKDQMHAMNYDGEMDSFEYWSGILKRRKQLCGMARGHVLESAVGSGRNVEFYDATKVQSLTMVDQSRALLDICRDKWSREGERARDNKRGMVAATFLVGDLQGDQVGHVLRSRMSDSSDDDDDDNKFDTVVQTMGLCSTPDPTKFLNNLSQVVKQDGRILLLEHGKSHYEWLNTLLDHTALDHAKKHGCWWNRDIGAIVADSGLIVEEIKRFQFGTTWWIVLRPKPQEKKQVATVFVGPQSTQSKWWHVW